MAIVLRQMKKLVDILITNRLVFLLLAGFFVISLILREWQRSLIVQLQESSENNTHLRNSSIFYSPQQIVDSDVKQHDQIPKFKIALGIFSVQRPKGEPDYVYAEVMSIFDTLMINQTYLEIDKIHVFDGYFNGTQVKYFKYSNLVKVHPMDHIAFDIVKDFPVHRKASLNYLLTLKYLVRSYPAADAYLVLEDDVIFHPESALIIWKILQEVKNLEYFLVDGYVKGPMRPIEDERLFEASNPTTWNSSNLVEEFHGDARCCSQSFLLSPCCCTNFDSTYRDVAKWNS
jgi:hypothetical protein